MAKLVTRAKLVAILDRERRQGRRIGFTSGAFDLLHVGHTRYLALAKRACDVLVVGVNSDASVRSYKGGSRPIVSARERAELVAQLACVDYVFVFSESNNAANIRLLKPGLYIKGGDYQAAELSSAKLLPKGAKVKLIRVVPGRSTSALVERIQNLPVRSRFKTEPVHRAVFVDRDGTIMESMDYPKDPSKVRLLPGAAAGLKRLQDAGYAILVVTNQPGIGLGYYTEEEFFRVDLAMRKLLSAEGAMVDRVYYCPHNEKDHCPCRKPKTYFVDRARDELGIRLEESFIIGDSTADIEMGRNAGVNTVLVRTGNGGRDGRYAAIPGHVAENFSAAAAYILGR